jgi:hypothetical protein
MKLFALSAALVLSSIHSLAAGGTPYLFTDFEDSALFPLGKLKSETAGLQVMTPDASIVKEEGDAKGHLQVSGSVVLLANRFTGDGQTNLEVWVKPRAVVMGDGMEFLDYDGAVLALFQTEGNHAELHALHFVDGGNAFWVSTGIQISNQDGVADQWHVVHIQQHWQQGSWDLRVDGVTVLEGLGRGQCADGKLSEVWLYGHGESLANSFDDLLLSAEPPDVLERELSALHKLRTFDKAQATTKQKRVGRQTRESQRRQNQLAQPDPSKTGEAKHLNISLQVVGGGRHIGEFESDDKNGEKQKFALYTPGYDENGKPKPLEVQIRCGAQLKEGATLGDIEWAITEHQGEDKKKNLKVILFGTFETGPSLVAIVPSEWSNKPLSIRCGQLGLKKRDDR